MMISSKAIDIIGAVVSGLATIGVSYMTARSSRRDIDAFCTDEIARRLQLEEEVSEDTEEGEDA